MTTTYSDILSMSPISSTVHESLGYGDMLSYTDLLGMKYSLLKIPHSFAVTYLVDNKTTQLGYDSSLKVCLGAKFKLWFLGKRKDDKFGGQLNFAIKFRLMNIFQN